VKGLCISGLNPKVFLLFLALLPQFTDPTGSWSIAMQMSALGMMHLSPVRWSICWWVWFESGAGDRPGGPSGEQGIGRVDGADRDGIAA
jgi:threonine/homoserine/homoserine lactone efflux protein